MSADLKSCCTAFYSSEAVRWLVGDSLHPGGAALTSRLGEALGVGVESTVLDVASGTGASAVRLARGLGCKVVGVELSPKNVEEARRAAAPGVCFVQGDAEELPFAGGSFDGALCECSFCLFPAPGAAAAEIARVLRPGARLAVSDVVAEPDRLPEELATPLVRFACIGAARPLEELVRLLEGAGLELEWKERHDDALAELVERIRSRLRPLGLDSFPPLLAARSAVADGALGYAALLARKP